MGSELASLVTILVREPGRVTAGGGEPLVRSRGVKELLQRVVHRAGHKRVRGGGKLADIRATLLAQTLSHPSARSKAVPTFLTSQPRTPRSQGARGY